MANYEHMLSVDNQDMVPNMEEFECPVCFDTVKAGDGVILRECLHKFCRYVVTIESFKMCQSCMSANSIVNTVM